MSTIMESPATRRSITLPSSLAEKVDAIAAERRVSSNRAIQDLLLDAVAMYEQRRQTFFDLADRFQKSTDPAETERLRDELAKLTFGN